jgi:hypothetical protein
MAGVEEDVNERSAHLAWRPQLPGMVAVGKHGAPANPKPVESARNAHEQARHLEREHASVVGFGDQVDVVRLQRVVRETESVASARARRDEAAFDRGASSVSPKIGEACVQSQGDVHGVARRKRLARPMSRDSSCSRSSRSSRHRSRDSAGCSALHDEPGLVTRTVRAGRMES